MVHAPTAIENISGFRVSSLVLGSWFGIVRARSREERVMKRLLTVVLLATGWLACAGSEARPSFGTCIEGELRSCACPNNAPGSERCNASGEFDACECSVISNTEPAAPEAPAAPPSCGDGTCNGSETCRSCARDCGACPTCSLAPSCTNAVGAPSSPKLREDLSQPPVTADGGAPDTDATSSVCLDPELRLRIERVVVHKGGGEIYCVVSATDGATSEAALTGKTKKLAKEETHFFDPATALYWGQKELHPTTNNLTVTFNCFVVKGDSWAKVLKAMGDTSTKLGGTQTPYGWAFGLGGVAANAAAAAVQAGAGDELRFNAQQVIDKKTLLDLTNGRYWSIRKTGDCGVFCDWDWEVFVQSWGCADAREQPH